MAENGTQNPKNQNPRNPGEFKGSSQAAAGSAATASVEDLARRLMDLWQEQMAAIAADPDLMRQMGLMMSASPFPAMMQGIIQGMMTGAAPMGAPAQGDSPAANPNPFEWWKPDAPRNPAPAPQGTAPQGTNPKAGPAAAAPASRPGGGELAELRQRLTGLEARLEELGEAGKRIVAESESNSAPGPKSGPKSEPASESRGSPGKPGRKPPRKPGGKPGRKPAGKVATAARRNGSGGSNGSGNGAAG
jgi:hypothetical protein